jgi:hypothetical protein
MEEDEQISIKPLQGKDNHREILKIMKEAQGLSRMSRLEEQKDGDECNKEDKPFMSTTS